MAKPQATHQLVVVDSRMSDWLSLVKNDKNANTDFLILDPQINGFTQIANAINSQYNALTTIHLVFHNENNTLFLGANAMKSYNLLSKYSLQLATISSALGNGKLLLYTDNQNAGQIDAMLVQQLRWVMKATVEVAKSSIQSVNDSPTTVLPVPPQNDNTTDETDSSATETSLPVDSTNQNAATGESSNTVTTPLPTSSDTNVIPVIDNLVSGTPVRDVLQGSLKNDYLLSYAGDDVVEGKAGDDYLGGYSGNDVLNGGMGNDYIDGGDGSDTLRGGGGRDTFNGGGGDDTYYIDDLNDSVNNDGVKNDNDTAYISIDNYPSSMPSVERVVFLNGVKQLPYFVDDLIRGYTWGNIGQAINLTYSFVSAGSSETNIARYSESQQAIVEFALAKFSAISGVVFTPANDSDKVDLRFFRDDLTGVENMNMQKDAGYAEYPPFGDVHLSLNVSSGNGLEVGNYGFEVLLHEIGHALGLKHPFEAPAVLPLAEDNTNNTLMSYNYNGQNSTDLKLFDKMSIHYLYGVNPTVRAGNDTYTFADRYIWDGGGIDTLSAAEQTRPVYIDLTAGGWIYAGQKATSIFAENQAFIGYGTSLENIVGSRFNDVLHGNALNNRLEGGNGNDVICGGAGNDVLIDTKGANTLSGGTGADSFQLNANNNMVCIDTIDSPVTGYDSISGFNFTDKLDLPYSFITWDVSAANGDNVGRLCSHRINQGLISFDDTDQYSSALTLTTSDLSNVIAYLQKNIDASAVTLSFVIENDSYVFQHGMVSDTLIELSGMTSSGLSNSPSFNMLWIA